MPPRLPVAVPRLSSPNQSARNWYPDRPPLSPHGRPDFSPLREEARRRRVTSDAASAAQRRAAIFGSRAEKSRKSRPTIDSPDKGLGPSLALSGAWIL